ncbi:MAG TPA: GNAT family N-acetyltransferase [Ktedonobacterales bacterium]|nr:GNAT family N-acetyltransferase [Ktedonobacterales bacterium]
MTESRQPAANDEVLVRRARPDDREAVLAFCAQTWSEGDYIESVWDDWMADERGAFLVAESGGRPVGIVHMRMIAEDEAWLEGMRVDPALRRQGAGRVLVSRALVAAREAGASVARLFTSASNIASQRLVAQFGFTRVAEVVQYDASAASADVQGPGQDDTVPAGARLTAPGVAAFERVWAWLEQSTLSPFNGGLEFLGWAARGLTEPALREYLAAGNVWLLEEWDTIQALAVAVVGEPRHDGGRRLDVRYIDGLSEAIGRLALALRQLASQREAASVQLWLPDLLILVDAMNAAGYTRDEDGAMWVYAREL